MARKIGIGIIGFGKWPRRAYAPVLRDWDEVEVVSVAARSDQTLAAAREAFSANLTVCHNYHDLLADDRVDAVMVATPNRLHGEVAGWAMRAGKHIFVEPPFGETSEEATALIDQTEKVIGAERPGLVFQADLELGYIPVLHRVRRMLSDGDLGEPISVSVRLWCDWGLGGNAGSDESARIGFFVWCGPWYLQLLDVLVGRLPQRVAATGVRAMNGRLMDHGWVSLDYEGDLIGRFEFNLLAVEGQDITVEVVGSRGEARANLCSGDVSWRTIDSAAWQVEHVPAAEPIVAFAGMRECLAGFVHAIAEGESVLADLAACRRIHQVVFAAQKAADDGIIVDLAGNG